MGGAGDFLAGLLGGLGETYGAAMLEKRRIDLTKKQLEQQNAQFNAQLAATKENTAAQLSLQRELGLKGLDLEGRRVGVAERGQNWEEKSTKIKMAWQEKMEKMRQAAERGNIKLTEQYRREAQVLSQQFQAAEAEKERFFKYDIQSLHSADQKELMEREYELRAIYDKATGKDLEGQMKGDLYKATLDLVGQMVANGMAEAGKADASARRVADSVAAAIINEEKDPARQKERIAAAVNSIQMMGVQLSQTGGGQFSSPESNMALGDALNVMKAGSAEEMLDAIGQRQMRTRQDRVDLTGAQNVLGGMGSKARNGVGPIKDANAPITDDEIPGPLRVVPKYGIDEVDPYPSRAPKPSGGAATRPFRGRR